jgi:hypothetical protein
MKDHTIDPDVRATVTDLLVRGLSAIGDKIFGSDDCRARERGWQIIPRHGGLSRSYRDPRFDSITPCTTCNGRGCNARGATCTGCDGTGRIVLGSAATSRQERGSQ